MVEPMTVVMQLGCVLVRADGTLACSRCTWTARGIVDMETRLEAAQLHDDTHRRVMVPDHVAALDARYDREEF
jgi:hypothetical protein